MTKHKSRAPAGASSGQAAKRPEDHVPESAPQGVLHRHIPSPAAIRETIESIVIAFVLAFLFRTFEAEAFVIPTGSMAPTLMGRHKDLACPKCGCPYQVSASDEVDAEGAWKDRRFQTESGTCPMCRYTALLGANNPQRANYHSYNGDRILVGKFAYEFADPQRWQVLVFKYPGDAPTNFIKRLVGLPGETIRIQNGDIWVRNERDAARGAGFSIARKPPHKLLAMLQPVFDNDYMPRIAKYGWPGRWYADVGPPAAGRAVGAWTSEGAVFHTDGAAASENWLRYHHLVPSYQQWQALEAGRLRVPPLGPQLITDFAAYNTGRNRAEAANPAPDGDPLGLHWVGDLALECTVEVENPGGQLIFELCKGGRRFQCRFDLATGRAALSIGGHEMRKWCPGARTAMRGKGRHSVVFSNCDNELLLWVDGRVVSFDAPTAYDDLGNTQPDDADLAPVGIASVGAEVRISRLRVLRDVYYIAASADDGNQRVGECDVRYQPGHALPSKPILPAQPQRYVDFPLKSDQFFVLGDNSAKSKDGRLWGPEYWVGRELLIGKALFIYWPHSWNKIPYVNVPFPYFPNVGRMGLVR